MANIPTITLKKEQEQSGYDEDLMEALSYVGFSTLDSKVLICMWDLIQCINYNYYLTV